MEQKKIGFFRRIFLAITDFRFYLQIVKESTFKAIFYFLKLIIISSVFISFYFMALTQDFVSDGIDEIAKRIPNFDIIDGELYISGDAKVDINEFTSLYMKDEYSKDLSLSFLPNDKFGFVATKDNLLFGNGESATVLLEYKDITNTNKQELLNNIKSINNSLGGKIISFLVVFCSVFVYMIINRTWLLLIYTLIVLICNILFVVRIKFNGFVKIAIYISTLPIILETFAICIGGKYSQTADFITFLIAAIYAFYSLRFIRISDVLFKAVGNTTEEKIVNAIKNAQEQLEKQIEDLEKNKHQEDTKNEESNTEKLPDEKSENTEDVDKNDDNNN